MRFLFFIRSAVDAATLLNGSAYIASLPFDVMIAQARDLFAARPTLPQCDTGLLDELSSCLDTDPEKTKDGIAKFIAALTGKTLSFKEFYRTYIKARDRKEPNTLNPISRLQNNVQAFLDALNVHSACNDTHCSLQQVYDGWPEVRLEYLPDLTLAFLTGRLISSVLAAALGQNAPRPGFIIPGDVVLESPMLNLGSALCAAADASYELDFDEDWGTCGLLTLVAMGMGCAETAVNCTDIDKPPALADLTKCDRFPQSSEPIDLSLSEWTDNFDLSQAEGKSWLYRWIAAKYAFEWGSRYALCGAPPPTLEMVPGWKTVLELWTHFDGSTALMDAVVPGTIPELTIAEKQTTLDGDGCEFLIIARGTATRAEWPVHLDARQVPLTDGPTDVLIHAGYARLADAMFPLLQHWLDVKRFDNARCDLTRTRFHFTGHSLGGSMATVMSLKTALRYKPSGAAFDLVAFAPSHALNQAGSDLLMSIVDVRIVLAELDMIPHFPCSNQHGLPRCDSRKCAAMSAVGRDGSFGKYSHVFMLTKEKLGSYSWPEIDEDGNPVVDEDGNPVLYKSSVVYNNKTMLTLKLSNAGVVFTPPSPLQFAAYHVCSYECFLTADFCFTDVSKASSCAC